MEEIIEEEPELFPWIDEEKEKERQTAEMLSANIGRLTVVLNNLKLADSSLPALRLGTAPLHKDKFWYQNNSALNALSDAGFSLNHLFGICGAMKKAIPLMTEDTTELQTAAQQIEDMIMKLSGHSREDVRGQLTRKFGDEAPTDLLNRESRESSMESDTEDLPGHMAPGLPCGQGSPFQPFLPPRRPSQTTHTQLGTQLSLRQTENTGAINSTNQVTEGINNLNLNANNIPPPQQYK